MVSLQLTAINSQQPAVFRTMRIDRHRRLLFVIGHVSTWALLCLGPVSGADLPTYGDFRRVDRVRRLTGQLHTAELLALGQIDVVRLLATVRASPEDWQLGWGGAELVLDWPQKRGLFEEAVVRSGTNLALVTRFACAAAVARDDQLAVAWLRYLQHKDTDNLVPWLAELWLRRRQPAPAVELFADRLTMPQPPSWCLRFRDYSVGAAAARIHALAAIGYSPYTARRLGYLPDPVAGQMARDLANQVPEEEPTRKLLLTVARAMQGGAAFLLTEMVGQSLESTLLTARPDATNSPAVRTRMFELDQRREALRNLLATTAREGTDFATEAEMIQYFDDLLVVGEEAAMKRLQATVKTQMGR